VSEEYKVQTETISAIVAFVDGHKEEVSLFKPESDDRYAATSVRSLLHWLNAKSAFLAGRRPKGSNTILINKKRICWIEMDSSIRLADEDRLGKVSEVLIAFPRTAELKGIIVNDLPEGQHRTLDFMNHPEDFFFLEAERVYFVNRANISRVYD
jgi:hypothetical protein